MQREVQGPGQTIITQVLSVFALAQGQQCLSQSKDGRRNLLVECEASDRFGSWLKHARAALLECMLTEFLCPRRCMALRQRDRFFERRSIGGKIKCKPGCNRYSDMQFIASVYFVSGRLCKFY